MVGGFEVGIVRGGLVGRRSGWRKGEGEQRREGEGSVSKPRRRDGRELEGKRRLRWSERDEKTNDKEERNLREDATGTVEEAFPDRARDEVLLRR